MELHHKLRRDPSWHPSACNICGQLGHQAVSCTNGTINWRQIYGDDAFRLKAPLYESDYQRIKKEKQIDFEALSKRARDYAEANKNAPAVTSTAPAQQVDGVLATQPQAAPGSAPPPVKEEEAPLPQGWAMAKDAQDRTYYWHTVTKKVQWDVPTADTPVE
eukprot:jgi/Botrbrau1/850/Bobra.0352s0043.1